MIIAIDGPSASGKSTTAIGVASKLGITYLDTGAMYRAVTYTILKLKVDVTDDASMSKFLENINLSFDNSNNILVDGVQLSNKIRNQNISSQASKISQYPLIREKMVEIQRNIGNANDCVLEGRDIGTVVFPNANYKFFLIADLKTRAERRYNDMVNSGENCNFRDVLDGIKMRDEMDSGRAHSPLSMADDAIVIDTGRLKINEQVNKIIEIVTN
jgi:cytidylate kinase